jgi:hypothetical protein
MACYKRKQAGKKDDMKTTNHFRLLGFSILETSWAIGASIVAGALPA